jgi:hypothetical protein
MSNYIDNLAAFKVLYSLVTPFEKTDAFKKGVIDKDGNVLVKIKDQTPEQKNSYDVLDRLVFSLKRLLGKIPGGKSQIASLAAAYYLIKESYESGMPLNEARVKNIFNIVNEGLVLVEEQILVEDFLTIVEEMGVGAIANTTGKSVATDQPVIRLKKSRRFGAFDVPDHVFRRFANGKKKFDKWSKYLDLHDESQNKIYQYAKKNPRGILILKNGESAKAIRYSRNTKVQQMQEMVVYEL